MQVYNTVQQWYHLIFLVCSTVKYGLKNTRMPPMVQKTTRKGHGEIEKLFDTIQYLNVLYHNLK